MAEWYPLTNSHDKVERVSVKIEHRLSLGDVAACILVDVHTPTYDGYDAYNLWAINTIKSRADAMNIVKNVLQDRSLENVLDDVERNYVKKHWTAIWDRLKLLW